MCGSRPVVPAGSILGAVVVCRIGGLFVARRGTFVTVFARFVVVFFFVLRLRLFFQKDVRTTFPRAWTEDIGHVGGKNHLVLTEQVGERIVLGRIFGENAFGAIILFVDDATHSA